MGGQPEFDKGQKDEAVVHGALPAWTKPVLIEMSVMEGTEVKGSEVTESSTTKNSS